MNRFISLTFISSFPQKLISIFFSGHVPPSTKTKDHEHIQRLKSLGLADEDIQV